MKRCTVILSLLLIYSLHLFAESQQGHGSVTLKIMTFNIENGGTQVSFKQVLEAIKKSGADIVGIQEPWGNTVRLATELGWKYHNRKQHIISRFPMFTTQADQELITYVEVRPKKYIAIANVHLPNTLYSPDLIKQGQSVSEIEKNEKATRTSVAMPFIQRLSVLAQQGVPAFLTGDFNSGSHLDWGTTVVGKLPNHLYVIHWPITQTLQKLNFVDSYRQIHPNVIKEPGYTWPGGRPYLKNAVDGFNPSKNEVSERIDYIFSAGPSKVVNSQLIGEANSDLVQLKIQPWPSDHRAVVSEFEVIPAAYELTNPYSTSTKINTSKEPVLVVSRTKTSNRDEITISWDNAPGNRYDCLFIQAINKQQLNPICIYIKGQIKGSMKFNLKDTQASGLDCYGEIWHFPKTPGDYDVKLMLDDSYQVIAKTQFKLK
jgi:exonuclease III